MAASPNISRTVVAVILLTLSVSRAPATPEKRAWPVPDWTVATPASQGMDEQALDRLHAYLEERQTRQALVIRHGRIVAEWYWRGSSASDKLHVFSVTKSITSTAVGLLAGDRKLRLDQPAADFIPAWKEDGRKAITIGHLLSMTSGLKREEYSYFMRQDQLAKSLAQPLEFTPGTKWEYNNLACNALSEIVSRASGQDLDSFLETRLFAPLGITHATMDKRGGRTLAYMGLRITARDLARIGYLFLNRGDWNGKRILAASWVNDATRSSQELAPYYGYLWWVHTNAKTESDPADSYEAIGLYGNYLCVFPSQDMILIRLIGGGSGSATDVDRARMKGLALAAIRQEPSRGTADHGASKRALSQ